MRISTSSTGASRAVVAQYTRIDGSCGKPQVAHFAHLVELLQWLPERVNFTRLEHCGGWSVRTQARWFARAFPFARLAVAALEIILLPRPFGELLALDAGFVPKSGDKTWGLGWFWSGMARAARLARVFAQICCG